MGTFWGVYLQSSATQLKGSLAPILSSHSKRHLLHASVLAMRWTAFSTGHVRFNEYVGNTFGNIQLISFLIWRNLKIFIKVIKVFFFNLPFKLTMKHLRDSLLRVPDGVRRVVIDELGQSLVESRHLVVVILLNFEIFKNCYCS